MVDELMGEYGSRFLIAAAAVAIALLCLAAVLWFLKNRSSSPFIRGGKNRQPRLAVLDAAAVDTRRRLVLVRRDDVEHLIMIGGPTDIVIESRIGIPNQPIEDTPRVATAAGNTELRQPDIRLSDTRLPDNRPQDVKPAATRPAEGIQTDLRKQETRPSQVVAPETRPQNSTQAAVRPELRQEPKVSPVSGMGQVLYSEEDEERLRQQRAAADARLARERATPALERREPLVERPVNTARQPVTTPAERSQIARSGDASPVGQLSIQPQENRQTPLVTPAVPATTPALSTEDILDAARLRVLPQQREEAVAPAGGIGDRRPEQRPSTTAEAGSDFERILDAEISGDLQRLTPEPQRDALRAAAQAQSRPGERKEPQLTTPMTGARNEPTIEQEMARMLGEMSVNRKT